MKVHKVPGKGVYARIGDFFGPLRKTEKQATEALDRALENYKPLSHTYVMTAAGVLLHLYQLPSHDFTIAIVQPDGNKVVEYAKGTNTLAGSITKATELADKRFGGVANVQN